MIPLTKHDSSEVAVRSLKFTQIDDSNQKRLDVAKEGLVGNGIGPNLKSQDLKIDGDFLRGYPHIINHQLMLVK